MLKPNKTVILIAAIIFVVGASLIAYASCRYKASVEMATSWYGPYDACDNYAKNTFDFTVEYTTGGYVGANCILDEDGNSHDRTFWANGYDYGDGTVVWWYENLSSNSDHRIMVDVTTGGGYQKAFTDGTYSVEYFASKSD